MTFFWLVLNLRIARKREKSETQYVASQKEYKHRFLCVHTSVPNTFYLQYIHQRAPFHSNRRESIMMVPRRQENRINLPRNPA